MMGFGHINTYQLGLGKQMLLDPAVGILSIRGNTLSVLLYLYTKRTPQNPSEPVTTKVRSNWFTKPVYIWQLHHPNDRLYSR